MNKFILAGALSATLIAGGALAAHAQGRQHPDPLAQADANGDGVVTRDEFLASGNARFASHDANKDGKITGDERKAVAGGRMGGHMGGRMMGRADANGDGAVTLEEHRAQALKRFDRIDANHDGKIDKTERDAAMRMMMSMRGDGPHGGHGRHMPAPGASPQTPPADQPSAPDGN